MKGEEKMAEIKYLVIDPESRKISIPEEEKLLGVENDEKTTRKYFQCPKIVGDNFDMSKAKIYVNIKNASGANDGKDRYAVENQKVSGNNVTFEWEVARKVTAYAGNVSFIVCAVSADGSEEWNTTVATGKVLEGLEILEPGEKQERGSDYLGVLTADATATEEVILAPYTAYIDGKKVAGSYVPLDTSDATARAEDMAEGTIAYVDGRQVVGTLTDSGDLSVSTGKPSYSKSVYAGMNFYWINAEVSISPKNDLEKMILNGTRKITASMSATDFGSASADQVLEGKTFTAVGGLKQTGTMKKGSTVKTGSFGGKGLQDVEIDTGLKKIESFIFHLSGATSSATPVKFGVIEVHYDGTYKRGSSYDENGTYIDDEIGKLTVSGGIVKYSPDLNKKKTYTNGNRTYNWIAIGS